MAKKKKEDADAEEVDGADKGSTEVAEKKEKKKPKKQYVEKRTNLGDTATIKRILDDAVIEVRTAHFPTPTATGVIVGDNHHLTVRRPGQVLLDEGERGYNEDTSMSNLKLFIGFSGVGASLLSHVYPAPFPRNWWCLLLCCAFYFAMSGLLQLLLSFVELESILLLRGKSDGKQRSVPGLNVSSHFPRFQEIYTLGITPVPKGFLALASAPKFRPDVPGGNTAAHCLQRSWAVEKYFDEEGIFAEEEFLQTIREFVSDYEALLAPGADGKKAQ